VDRNQRLRCSLIVIGTIVPYDPLIWYWGILVKTSDRWWPKQYSAVECETFSSLFTVGNTAWNVHSPWADRFLGRVETWLMLCRDRSMLCMHRCMLSITTHWKYFKFQVEYTLHSQGQDCGVQSTNTGLSAAASLNINLKSCEWRIALKWLESKSTEPSSKSTTRWFKADWTLFRSGMHGGDYFR